MTGRKVLARHYVRDAESNKPLLAMRETHAPPKMLRLMFAAALSFVAVTTSAMEADRTKLVEASTNFDQESVQPFLVRVAGLVQSGFDNSEATRLAADIGALELEKSQSWEFSVSFDGKPTPLVIEAFQDDYEAPDLYFFTSKEFAARIEAEMEAFAEELGQ